MWNTQKGVGTYDSQAVLTGIAFWYTINSSSIFANFVMIENRIKWKSAIRFSWKKHASMRMKRELAIARFSLISWRWTLESHVHQKASRSLLLAASKWQAKQCETDRKCWDDIVCSWRTVLKTYVQLNFGQSRLWHNAVSLLKTMPLRSLPGHKTFILAAADTLVKLSQLYEQVQKCFSIFTSMMIVPLSIPPTHIHPLYRSITGLWGTRPVVALDIELSDRM
jgi:hypothetical protein